jgi:hypothetical protein
MGFGRMSVSFARMLCGGSAIALFVVFGGRLMGFRGILVMRGRFVMSLFWHYFLRLAL